MAPCADRSDRTHAARPGSTAGRSRTCRRNKRPGEEAPRLRKLWSPSRGCRIRSRRPSQLQRMRAYDVTRSNERGRGKPLRMTRKELLRAFGASATRRCFYCGISEAAYIGLRIPTPSGKPGLRLGLDRIDSAASYTPGNVVICCLVCNRVKSSTFSHREMVRLGRAIHESWVDRGLDARLT